MENSKKCTIDSNLCDLLSLVEFHNTTDAFSECTVNENIILLVVHPETKVTKYVEVIKKNDDNHTVKFCNQSSLHTYDIVGETHTNIIVYNLPEKRKTNTELDQSVLKNDKQVKQALSRAKKMKVMFYATFDNKILNTNLTVNIDDQISYLDQQVQALLDIVPNSRESVGFVVMADYPTDVTLVDEQKKWMVDILKKHSTSSDLIKKLKAKDSGIFTKHILFHPNNITVDTKPEILSFMFNKTQFADSNEIGFEINYLDQTLHTVKSLFNSFNSTVDAIAKEVFRLITPDYYGNGSRDLKMLNQTYYKFYETMYNFDFSNRSTYLPINVAECLGQHKVKITKNLQDQFDASFPSYVEHRKVVNFFSKHKYQESALVKELFNKANQQLRSNQNDGKLLDMYASLKSSLDSMYDGFDLKASLMELDMIINLTNRTDEPSKIIHDNIDGAVTIIEGEIEETVSRTVKISNQIYETTLDANKMNIIELMNTITNITHFLSISKLHRTIETELYGPTEVFKRAIRKKLTRLEVETEDAVKASVSLTAERSLKNVIAEMLIVYKLGDYNTTVVLTRLDILKLVMETTKPMVNENFSIEQFTKWLERSTIVTPKEYVEKFIEDKQILDNMIDANVVYDQKLTGNNISNRTENHTTLTFAFKHQNGVLANRVNGHYEAFKIDVIVRTVEKIIENSAYTVDEEVYKLDNMALKKFKIMFAKDPEMSREQPLRRLQWLQDSRFGFQKFMKELKSYFEIHYMSHPNNSDPILQNSLIVLEDVKEIFIDVERRLGNQRRGPIITDHQWGRKFLKTKAFLTSSASTNPSFINAAVKWCVGKTQNLLRSASWPSFNHMLPNTKPLSINGCHSTSNTTHSSFQQTNIISLILLFDLILRKVTRAKPQQQYFKGNTTNFLSAQGHTLNIVAECEQMLTELRGDNDVAYDFVSMQQQLMYRITQLGDMEGVEVVRQDALATIKSFYYGDNIGREMF